ncbi:crotonobetainyl-CoA:carnitine CoA-transferase CaiB-like acyl-CoA transferase [Actinomadura pelletieri DSM 43383]|uniref:Crotonobetainyl-CoA:carnitine CoA-transferase CaiB-like acyl-CoA transferase n=1 Tax=Actinomadura pelletieri DSM 43383 TaxID=1120940 RepID=A0A495QG70_9ACTN|nr:crotonobetainyl-CoA:carnitine CoA-transferase CaiB-like acyl-CoA transferase [Actinomadura pelletieri DSM 43383]
MSGPEHVGPLLRVVELAEGVAGQVCGRLFAGFGHTVIKCEPPGGDPLRTREPVDADGLGYTFTALNADKQSVCVDPESPDGRARLAELLSSADILITDFGPGRAARTGLTPHRLRSAHPRLVIVALTPYGVADERSDVHGDSLLAESYGGLAAMVGEPDRAPLSLGGEQTAHAAAFVGFYGSMLALRRPGGDVVDVALCDVAAYIDWKSDVVYAETGQIPTRTGTNIGRWRTVRAADGWIGLIYTPEQWDSVVELIGDPALEDPRLRGDKARLDLVDTWWPAVERWAAARTKREIYNEAQRLGLPFGYGADLADLVADPQYRARSFVSDGAARLAPVVGLPWRFGSPRDLHGTGETTGPRPPIRGGDGAAAGGDPAPLAGVVVLDLGTITAGAATGRLLADYGATVIKIESMGRPDAFRVWPVPTEGDADVTEESPLFESNNAGKLGITLDLKTDSGRAEMRRLVERSDVLIENFTVGVTRRLGIDCPTLMEVNPRLIYLSLSSQGQSGPESGTRSYGSSLDLLSGLASVTGYQGGRPMWSSADINYPDQIVSLFGAGLIAYCLAQNLRGTYLDVSQRELVSWTLADRILEHLDTGTVPEPTGNRRPGSTPHDVYRCAGDDQWIAIACRTDTERAALATLVGAGGMASRPSPWWERNHEEVDAAINAWSGSRSKEECLRELTLARVPSAPVLSARERAEDPHFRRRRVFLDEPRRQKGFPLRLLGYEPPPPRPAPRLGQHDAELRDGHWPGAEARPAAGRVSVEVPPQRSGGST